MKKPRAEKSDISQYDHQRALEIFREKLKDQSDGSRSNSQMKRDAELIYKLLEEAGEAGARLSVFASTFEALFGIARDKAGTRCRIAIKFLTSSGRITAIGDKQPIYSLTKNEVSGASPS